MKKKLLFFACLLFSVFIVLEAQPVSASVVSTETINTRLENRYFGVYSTYGVYNVRQYYKIKTTEYLSAGTSRLFEDNCPSGWTLDDGGGVGISPWFMSTSSTVSLDETDDSSVVATTQSIPDMVVCTKNTSGNFVSYSSEQYTQSTETSVIYWDDVPESEKYTFTMNLGIIDPKSHITIIEGEVLIMKNSLGGFQFGIDRYTHYERNQYNINFPTSLNVFKSTYENQYDCDKADDAKNYFHRIALYNGDTSNFDNIKYTCNVPTQFQNLFPNGTSEVIYGREITIGDPPVTNRYMEVNPLVVGTFNFSSGIKDHYIEDVYPYLVWGNSFNDESSYLERLGWSESSQRLDNDWYKYREYDLIIRLDLVNALSLTYSMEPEMLSNDMYNINNH